MYDPLGILNDSAKKSQQPVDPLGILSPKKKDVGVSPTISSGAGPKLDEGQPTPHLQQLMTFHQEQQTDALRRQPALVRTIDPQIIKQRNIDDSNKINDAITKSGGDAERAAFIYHGVDETGMAEAKAGSYVKNFLNNPNVIQRAQQDPNFKKAYNTAKFNFQNHYPTAAAKDVNQKIGQYMEDTGMANGVYNNPSKEKADKAVKEMRQKGILDDRELHLYETKTKPKLGTVNSYLFGSPIPTADVVNEFSRSLERQGGNVAEATRDVLHNVSLGAISYPEEQKITEQKEYATPTVEAKGEGKKFALNIADILGFATPAILGEVAGVPAMGTMSLQFEGQNRRDAMIKYPDDKTKQDIYTILTTGVDLAAGQKLPLGEAGKAIGGLVDDVVAGKITEQVAKDKYLEFAKEWGKQTLGGTAALETMQVGHNAADAALGGKNFNLVEQGKQALEQLPSDLVAMAFMGGIAASRHLMGRAETPQPEAKLEEGKGEVQPTKIGEADVSEHAEDVKSAKGLENGIAPSRLSEEGKSEAKDLGNYIVDNNQNHIVSSEVSRAQETAKQAAKEANDRLGAKEGVTTSTNPLLNTADIGKDDGKPEGTFDEIGWAEGKYLPEGAETFKSFTDRMEKAHDYVKSLPETTHVVAHSKVIRALQALDKTDGRWTDETTKEFLKEEAQPPAQPPSQEVQPTPTGEPYDKLVKEHEELIPILESGTPEERKKLADEQRKELEEYRRKAGVSVIRPEENRPPNIIEPTKTEEQPPTPPITRPPTSGLVYFQYPPTQLSHGGVERIGGEHGFEPTNEYETSSILKWNKEADDLMAKGFSVQNLLHKVDAGEHIPLPEERVVLTRYAAELQKRLREIEITNPEYDHTLEELQRVANVANLGGSQSGASLGAIGLIKVVPDGSYAEFMLNELAANRNAPLTDTQKRIANEEWTKLDEAQRKLEEDQKVFEQKVAAFKAEQELSQTKKLVSKTKRRSHEDLAKERADILKNIKDKWMGAGKDILSSDIPYRKQLAAIAPDVLKLARNLVEDGILKLEEVVNNIHGQLKDVSPELTEKDIHDVLAGEYNERNVTRKEAAIQFENLKQKAALINKLERAESGRTKTEKQERKKNQEIAQFKKELGIDKLEQLQSLKTRVQSETDKIINKIKKGDFAPEIKKTPLMEDKELQQKFPKDFKQTQNSLDQYIKAKREIAKRLAKQMYENKTSQDKAYDVIVKSLNVPRTLMASFDFSAPLRQGIVASIAHPKIASRALKFMFESAKDEKVYNRWLEEVHNSPRWEWASKTDLGITDPESLHLRKTEEAFQGAPYAELIPLIGGGVKASERAYIGFLNKMRWDLFNMYADRFEQMGKTYENNPKLYQGLSSFINSETGRGGIGIKKLEQMSPVLNTLLFASKLIASRLNLLGLTDIPNLAVRAATFGKYGIDYGFYTKLPAEIRWEAAKDMAKFIGIGMATLAMAKMMGANVEDDPRSSDFGKIHVGNTRWDIWGGFQPYARVLTQTLTGQRKTTTTGQIQELGGTGFMAKSRFAPLATFARQKLAPVPGTIINLAQGTDATGQPVTITSQLLQDVTPLLIQDVYQGMKDQGVKAIFTVGIPSALGVGVQTYQQNQPKPKSTGGGAGAKGAFKKEGSKPKHHKQIKSN